MTEKKFSFLLSIPYLIILSLATLGFWYFGLEKIGIPLFLAVMFILLVFEKNTMPVVPLLLNPLFMISQTEWSLNTIPTYLIAVPIVLIVGFIIHIIRFKVKLLRGEMMIGLLLMVAALLLSTINTSVFDTTYLFLMVVGIFYVFVYFFFVNSIEGDNTLFLIRLFIVLGLLVSIEVFIYYLRVPDVVYALEHKSINLGWGISNFIATYLIIFISSTIYFVKKYKMHIIWMLIVFFEISMLFFTLSRGGILAFGVTSILLAVYMFVKYDHKLNLLINLLIALAIFAAIYYFSREYIRTIWDWMRTEMLNDRGRYALWQAAFEKFKSHPLFGVGLYSRVLDGGSYLGLNHNTIIQTAAAFGIIGLLSLAVMFWEVMKIFFYKLNHKKAILLIALFGANVHGMVDNIFYMPQFMIIFFIIIAVVEIANKEVILKPEINQ